MKVTTNYEIPATVIETGEHVMVNNPGEGRDNPWGFYAEMWHFTEDGRIFHVDELELNDEEGELKKRTAMKVISVTTPKNGCARCVWWVYKINDPWGFCKLTNTFTWFQHAPCDEYERDPQSDEAIYVNEDRL